MAKNREMLKEAIAEAKTIKETAIANAKAALEEAFTPQLTAMFAERLNEEEEEEEQNENYSLENKEELEETFNLDEILAELDEMNYEELEETKDKSEENLMLEEMSDEEIEELILKVLRQEIESGNIEAGENFEEEESEKGDMEDMEDIDDMGAEEEESEEEEVEIDELLAEILAEEEELEELELPRIGVDKAEYESMLKDAGITDPNMIQKLWYKFLALTTKNKEGETISTGASSFTGGGGSTYRTDETKEMEETIAELRSELNEVNLLNAKLLYTNKIFKAKNLTESEKVKVLNTFDKAETVKEVKLVYETLTESLKASTAKKNTIKESLGSASKTISAPAETKQPIIEVNDAFARMQRLAGLRK